MGTEGFKRKITAIMSADVVGYSKLMGDDEAATVKTLAIYKDVMTSLITQHRGRVIDSPGDNMLSEFASVVDAVQCAVSIQKELKSRNAELPENRKMRFRIGINLGDVIEEQNRIFGDGVNIAARLESLANPDGICVSKTAFDHIESKLPLGYEYIGKQNVKNIEKPVDAYRVLMDSRVKVAKSAESNRQGLKIRLPVLLGIGASLAVIIGLGFTYILSERQTDLKGSSTSHNITAYHSYDKPSFAVLPFDNISKDNDVDYLCDGMAETLINTLSKLPDLYVISRNSTFTYKGKNVQIKEVAENLGVQYVIEGSVQKSGEKLRLSVQMVEALTQRHVFSEQFNRNLKDIFELQDEIVLKILKSIEVSRTGIDKYMVFNDSRTENLEAYVKYLKALHLLNHYTEDSLLQAKAIGEEVIKIDPKFSEAYELLSIAYMALGRSYSRGEKRKNYYDKGVQLAEKVIEMDNSIGSPYVTTGLSHLYNKQYDEAISDFKKSMELQPSYPWSYSNMGLCLFFKGRMDESEYYAKEAIRLDPLQPANYLRLGRVYFHKDRYDDAIRMHMKVLELMKMVPYNESWPHTHLSMVYGESGQEDMARLHMNKVLELNPKFNLEARRRTFYFEDPAYGEKELSALRKAGAPEHPPSD